VPMRITPRPIAEARQAMTVRLPVSMHERLRVLMFASRRSQQQIVEDALDAFLKANQT
jgi:predicted transcriptional regulator